MQKNKSSFNPWHWLFWWKINKEDVHDQIEKYSSLGFFSSYRKFSSLVFIYASIINLYNFINSITRFNHINFLYLLHSLLFLSISPFIWQGRSWAIKGGMILWTYSQAFFAIYNTQNYRYLGNIFWWFCIMSLLYANLIVEKSRKNDKNNLKLKTKLDHKKFLNNSQDQQKFFGFNSGILFKIAFVGFIAGLVVYFISHR